MFSNVRSTGRIVLLAFILALTPFASARGEDVVAKATADTTATGAPMPPRRRWYDPRRGIDRVRQRVESFRRPEIVEMLIAIAQSSEMGPGEGWFHAGQGRYGWNWLVDREDTDGDGVIDREEFFGPAEWFDRLDRDHDGTIKSDDFDWSDDSKFVREAQQARQLCRRIDRQSNGRISRAEWEAFFEKAAQGGDELTPEDLRAALNPPEPPSSPDDEPSPWTFLKGFWTGELGSIHDGPDIGGRAPDFELPCVDGRDRLRLSERYQSKPVVLIFGSFT